LVSRTPAAAMVQHSPSRGCLRRPLGPDITCAQSYRLGCKPCGLATDASCRASLLYWFYPALPVNTKDPFHGQRTNAAAFQAQSAFRLRVLVPCAQPKLVTDSEAAAGTSVLPPRPSVRHAFTRRYALDPITLPAIHRSFRATCRSSTSAIGRTHEHNLESSRPWCSSAIETVLECDGNPPRTRWCCKQHQLSWHNSGVSLTFFTFGQPP
jgi:hypothetical protein